MSARILIAAGVLAAAAVAGAQERPQSTAPGTPDARATSGSGVPAAAAPGLEAYEYDPQGRRDPFVSLLSRGSDPKAEGTRPAGLQGLLVSEIAVKGIVRDRSGYIAMVQGPNTKTFIVRSGERLMDGTVKVITAEGVIFSQDVSDPLSLVKHKEVKKTVRAADGGRN